MSTNNNQTEDKPRLSNEQKQKMKKYAVFALMGVICAGCIWFIFAPLAVQNSVNAYRDVNRTLGSFYETPKSDPEKERLKQELEELKMRMNESENRKKSTDEQLALMEKSFRMAAKYIPGTAGAAGTPSAAPEPSVQENGNTRGNVSGKAAVVPVGRVREQTVSLLQGEMSGAEFIETYSLPRNMGFVTATAEVNAVTKNTILACIHDNQTIADGQSVRLRLLEPMRAGSMPPI